MDMIAFEANNALFVSQVMPLSKAAYDAYQLKLAKRTAMMNTKNVALGIMLYLGDNDDVFPPKDQMYDLVLPYTKDQSMTRNFVYTYGGPLDISKIENPSGTEIGYVNGPGGRAVAYADGHVKWIPNP